MVWCDGGFNHEQYVTHERWAWQEIATSVYGVQHAVHHLIEWVMREIPLPQFGLGNTIKRSTYGHGIDTDRQGDEWLHRVRTVISALLYQMVLAGLNGHP